MHHKHSPRISFAWFALTRPQGEQSSYSQPVHLLRVNGEFLSGSIKSIQFAFTNEDYQRAFEQANAAAIERKVVKSAAA